MTYRKIETRIWADSWHLELPVDVKFMFYFFITCEQGNNSGMFECPVRIIENATGLSKERIEKAIDGLFPKVKYFKNWVHVVNFRRYQIDGVKWQTSADKFEKLVPKEIWQEFQSSDRVSEKIEMPDRVSEKIEMPELQAITITKPNQTKQNITSTPKPPSVEKQISKAKLDTTPYQEIADAYNAITGLKIKYTGEAFQKLVRGRFAENYTLEDFKTVLQNKKQWLNESKMAEYYKPSTLFSKEHFSDYLNKPQVKSLITPAQAPLVWTKDENGREFRLDNYSNKIYNQVKNVSNKNSE